MILQHTNPDVLITTLRLGEYNGLHLALISRARYPTMPAVVIGDCGSGVEVESSSVGALALVRPVSPEQLVRFVEQVADSSGAVYSTKRI